MAGVSFKSLVGQELRWSLTSLDDDTTVIGQYQPEDAKKAVGSKFSVNSTIGRPQPIVQFDSEGEDRITFTARVWAAHAGLPSGVLSDLSDVVDTVLQREDQIEDLVEKIDSLPRVVPDLGRPRIWTFAVGASRALEMDCVVESVGPISFAALRPFRGDLRGASFQISLIRFEEYDVTLSGGAPAESLIVPVRPFDSYETLSKRTYGNASSGEALRRRNPDNPVPTVGDRIHMPPQSSLTEGFRRQPLSPVLQRRDRFEARRREHQAKRGKGSLSYALGPEWDGVK